ncbi:MAG TPA: copper resistance CopC family protein [Cellulomonas sp.]
MSSEHPLPDRRPSTARAVAVAAPRPTPVAPRLLGVVAALLLALAAVVAGAARADAHNSLQGSDPADGATVATAPERITLTFDEPAQALGTEIVVVDPDGTTVSSGAPELVDATVSQPLAGSLPAGAYSVQWRVTSADGHPISGAFTFTASAATTVGASDPGSAMTTQADPTEPAGSTTAPEPAVTATAPATLSSPSITTETAEDTDAGLAAGAIVAIVVAVLAAGAVTWFVVRERRRSGDRTEH